MDGSGNKDGSNTKAMMMIRYANLNTKTKVVQSQTPPGQRALPQSPRRARRRRRRGSLRQTLHHARLQRRHAPTNRQPHFLLLTKPTVHSYRRKPRGKSDTTSLPHLPLDLPHPDDSVPVNERILHRNHPPNLPRARSFERAMGRLQRQLGLDA